MTKEVSKEVLQRAVEDALRKESMRRTMAFARLNREVYKAKWKNDVTKST